MIKEYQRYVRYLLSLWYVQNGKHELHAGYQCSFGADQKGFFSPTVISDSNVVFRPGRFPCLLPLFLKLCVCPNAFNDFCQTRSHV